MTQHHDDPLAELFGEPIHIYTRAQAIADGLLVDVAEKASSVGFRVPVAMTADAWADCVTWTHADSTRKTYQDEAGRLADVLWMAHLAARRARDEQRIAFKLVRVPRGGSGTKPRVVTLHLAIGPGDNGEPVMTILLPNED